MMPKETPAWMTKITSAYRFDETVARLKQAIEAADFLLIHEINTQQILARQGITIAGLKQLLYFQPAYMKQLLDLYPEVAIEAPLKFVVREAPDQSVKVLYVKPTYLFSRYAGLEKIGEDLEKIAVGIAVAITAQGDESSGTP